MVRGGFSVCHKGKGHVLRLFFFCETPEVGGQTEDSGMIHLKKAKLIFQSSML